MIPEGSLECSQEPTTGPYPEPDESSPPKRFPSAPCSQTPSTCVLSLMCNIQVAYKTTGKIIVLCILIFTFLDSMR
jgi:hypothetical protein